MIFFLEMHEIGAEQYAPATRYATEATLAAAAYLTDSTVDNRSASALSARASSATATGINFIYHVILLENYRVLM